VATAGRLLGQRLVLTEVVSYQELGVLAAAGELSPRTLIVLSYALCGFAHVGGMSIAVGGFAALAPGRLDDLTRLALRALVAATLATLSTGALAGVFYHGQPGLLGL
jgi:CNT family concentrative nucleoside transporter